MEQQEAARVGRPVDDVLDRAAIERESPVAHGASLPGSAGLGQALAALVALVALVALGFRAMTPLVAFGELRR